MGVNMSKMLWSVGAGGAATLLVYSWWKVERPLTAPATPIMGLRNCGNTCFLNAVLQALASCRFMVGWLRQKDEECNPALTRPVTTMQSYSGVSYPLIAALLRGILVMNREIDEDDTVFAGKVPSDVLSGLRFSGHQIGVHQEQDAYEVFLLIAMALNHEVEMSVRRKQTGSMSALTDDDVVPGEGENVSLQVNRAGMNDIDVNAQGDGWTMIGESGNFRITDSIYSKRQFEMKWDYRRSPKNPFRCLMFSQMKCIVCLSKTSVRMEAADSLTLTLPPPEASSSLSIQDLLLKYMRPILVHQVDCETCTAKALAEGRPIAGGHTKVKSTFFKYNYVAKLPNSLCIHIPRCIWGPYGMIKRTEYIGFPERINLGILRRLYDKEPQLGDPYDFYPAKKFDDPPPQSTEAGLRRFKNSEYRLMAVISHFGSVVESGHFVTFRRLVSKTNPNVSTWYYVSDEEIQGVPFSCVLGTRAYNWIDAIAIANCNGEDESSVELRAQA